METVGVLLVLAALAGLILGVITLIRPIRRLGLGTRKRASLALAASFIAFIIGAAMLPPTQENEMATETAQSVERIETAPAPTGSPHNATVQEAVKSEERQFSPAPSSARAEEVRRELEPLLDRLYKGALYPGLPNPKITVCTTDDAVCEADQLKFLKEWKTAHAGNYGAQRNVAYCLSSGRGCGGVVPDRVQGCAWRSVIIVSADPEMDEGDVSNFETDCRRLSEAGRVAADAQAARIKGLIDRSRR